MEGAMMPPEKMAELGEEMAGALRRVVYDPSSAIARALEPLPMADAPLDKPIIVVSAWGETAVVIWDADRWRYGPDPGATWDADYPRAWIPLHACHWLKDKSRIADLEDALAAIYSAADNAGTEQEWADMVSAQMTDERRALVQRG